MGHSIGLDDQYFTPVESYILQEYLKAVDNLTINEENRLRIKVNELTKRKNEIETMELRHREEIKVIHDQMNQVVALIQKNPKLANIKPEILITKKSQNLSDSSGSILNIGRFPIFILSFNMTLPFLSSFFELFHLFCCLLLIIPYFSSINSWINSGYAYHRCTYCISIYDTKICQ